MRRLVQIIVALVFVGFGAFMALTRFEPLQDWVVRRTARGILAKHHDELFKDDALRVVACGTSSPLSDHDRASACVAVFAGDRFYVVDTGMGAWKNLALLRVPPQKIG